MFASILEQLRPHTDLPSQKYLFPITAQKKYLFLIPPIEEQKQFAAFAVQIAKSKAAVQKALDQTQLLFDSLMQEYFG